MRSECSLTYGRRVVLPGEFVVVRERARPLSPEERREAILEAVLPLLRERGRDVTSRELAEASGVAEGTLFRAFGDKESLLDAALRKLLDRREFLAELRRIPMDLPLDDKLGCIVSALRARFGEVFRIMTLFGIDRPPPLPGESQEEWLGIVRDLLEPELPALRVPVDTVVWYLRLVAFGASIEPFSHVRSFGAEELAGIVAHGVTRPAP